MSEERGRSDANACFVCGPDNPNGLRLVFRMADDVCHATFTPDRWHCGYDEQVHGGLLFSVLDDVMANWLFLQGIRAHTAKCEIRFRKPVQVGTQLLLEGHLLKRKGRLAQLEGIAKRASDGETVADAQATFMVMND